MFNGGCWPTPLLVKMGIGSSSEMDWSFDRVGMFTCVWGEQWHGSDLVWELTAQRAAGQVGMLVCACSVRCVTFLTLCAGTESGLSWGAVAQQTMTCWPIFKQLKCCIVAATKDESGEHSLVLHPDVSPGFRIFCFFCCCNSSSREKCKIWLSNLIDCEQ